MGAVFKKIGKGLKSFGNFFAALGDTKKQPAPPDPRKAAARKMRESMHASRAGSTANNSDAEKLYAKEYSKGYQEQQR